MMTSLTCTLRRSVICHKVLAHYSQAQDSGRSFTQQGGGCGDVQVWNPHGCRDCNFCSHLEQRERGGRPGKRRKVSRVGFAMSDTARVCIQRKAQQALWCRLIPQLIHLALPLLLLRARMWKWHLQYIPHKLTGKTVEKQEFFF